MYNLTLTYTDNRYEMQNDNAHCILRREIGFSPVQMLVASIGACGGYVLTSILDKMQIKHEMRNLEMTFEVNQDSKAKEPTYVGMVFHIQVHQDDSEKVLHALSLVPKYCPVMLSLNDKVIIEKQVCFIPE